MRGFWFGRGGEGLRGEEVEGGVGMGDVGSMRWSVGEGGPERRWTWRFDWRDGWTWLVGDLAGEGKAVLDDRRGKLTWCVLFLWRYGVGACRVCWCI